MPFLEAGRSSSDADSYGGQLNPRIVAVLRRARVGAPGAAQQGAPLSLHGETGAGLSQMERIETDKARRKGRPIDALPRRTPSRSSCSGPTHT